MLGYKGAFVAVGMLSVALCAAACGDTKSDGDGGAGGQPFGGAGGSAGSGGSGGSGGSSGSSGSGGVPGLTTTDKIDLLLVIDNSISMTDKQQTLVETVPRLVQRLVAPRCLDGAGAPVGASAPCPAGTTPEFAPLADLHVGVITSSLGSHGGNVCAESAPTNDRAHLLPDVRPGLPHAGNGFLTWQAGTDPGALIGELAQHVVAAGEAGCGFEAPLESWYRFLVDPNPPADVVNQNGVTVATGTDSTVLSQRAAFLRPDSLLAVVVLSDENDCSIRDSDVGWYVSTIFSGSSPAPLAKPTSVCETEPNSPCCRSCADVSTVSGCPATDTDPACDGAPLDPNSTDRVNVRCWEQKRRFGIDFMYPTERYVNALRKSMICPTSPDLSEAECDTAMVPNPIYLDLSGAGKPTRGSDLVLFMSIVGVPWQDLATSASLGDPNGLEYLSAQELAAQGRWDWITGDYETPPLDPLMIESMQPRSGQSPATGEALAPPSAAAGANAANGHEWDADDTSQGDLQYACIFPLAVPRDCDATPGGCDCHLSQAGLNNPLCQAPGSAAGQGYSSLQQFAKGYPGRRYLSVARDVQEQAVVASICPKIDEPTSPAYAYTPAVDALVRAMRTRLVE